MSLSKTMLRRLKGANPKKSNRSPSPAELLRNAPPSPMARIELARRAAEAEAAKLAEAAPPPDQIERPEEAKAAPVDATPGAPPPPEPGMPPPEPQWWEEKCRWRERGAADYDDVDDDDGVYYETIHRYDPLERADEEEYYDPDE
jgi:hypothetical protein